MIYKQRFFGILGITVFLLTAAQTAGANTIYPINLTVTTSDPTGNPAQSDTVNGSITTDGTIGPLASTDILSWNLNLIDHLNAANDFDLTPANSTLVEDTGSALSATAGGLYFNYSGTGEFLIQANNPGAYTGYHYFCFSTGGACLAGESIVPLFYTSDGVVLTGSSAPVGNQPLNTPSGVPEPSEYALVLTGLVFLSAKLKRKSVK